MRMRTLGSLLLIATGVLAGGCAENQAGISGAGTVPLASFDCYEVGDVYSQVTYYSSYSSLSSPCTGFVYGDYEQYPNFTPTRQVILSSDRNHQTRVVARPAFSNDSGYSPWNTSSSASTASGSTSPPRMDPIVVSPPADHPVISRQ